MARVLHLTNDQFGALYDIVKDAVDYIEGDLITTEDENGNEVLEDISDYEIYQVWQQMNNYQTPKVTVTPEDNDPVIINLPEGTNLTRVIRSDDDYASKVDTFVGNMVASDDNVFTHDSEGC